MELIISLAPKPLIFSAITVRFLLNSSGEVQRFSCFLSAKKEEKVAAVPGTAFGASGEGFLRISYAYSLENLKVAMGRMQRFVEKLRKEQAEKQ